MSEAGSLFAEIGLELSDSLHEQEPFDSDQVITADNLAARWFHGDREADDAEKDAVLGLPEDVAIGALKAGLVERPEWTRGWELLSEVQWRAGQHKSGFESFLSSSYIQLHLAITLLEPVLQVSPEYMKFGAALDHMLEASAILRTVRESGATSTDSD